MTHSLTYFVTHLQTDRLTDLHVITYSLTHKMITLIDVEVMVISKTLLSIFDKYILIKNHLVSDNRNRPVDVHFLKEYASSYEFNVN